MKFIDCDYCLAEGQVFNGKILTTCPKCKGKKKILEELLDVNTKEFDYKIYGEKKVIE